MIKQSFNETITHIDLPNKVYNEESVKKYCFLGITIFKKTYNKIEVMPTKENKMGFNK